MLNPKLKLNSKLFNEDVEKISIREGFRKGLLQAGEENKNVVAVCADLRDSVQMDLFAEKFEKENRFIEVGVAEQNLVTVASGLAKMGKIPFCGSYAVFSPGRNWEQIRTTIAYNDVPVKVIGSHTGVTVGPDGGSHQMLEDIALMRVMPNFEVFSPCDAIEAKKITLAISKTKKPSYLRLVRDKTVVVTTEETPFEIGKSEIYWLPEVGIAQVGIIATGEMLYHAILAAKELEQEENIKVKVMNLASIKPVDADSVINLAKETKCLVTVEDHQAAGGIGSLVSEILAQVYPMPIEFVGVKDRFGQSGTSKELLKEYSLDKDAIKNAVKKVLKRKV
jgi:transketolase